MIWCDGQLLTAAPPGDGRALFETIGYFRSGLVLWDLHLARLCASLRHFGIVDEVPAGLRSAVGALLSANGHDVARVERRLLATGPRWLVSTRARQPVPVVRLVPAIARRPLDALPADHKLTPRAYYDAVLAEAQRAGADDGIVVGDDGALLETAHGNLWLLLDAVWTTPPLDGRLLPGIARALLLDRARAQGVPVAMRRLDFGDLHRATAICVSNSVYGPRPAALVADPVGETGSSLRRLWQFAVADRNTD